jgi:predicted aminopeptidase
MPDATSRSSRPLAPAANASAATRSARSAATAARIRTKAVVAAASALTFLPGCYYAHLARGQLAMLRAERPIEQVIGDPATAPTVRDALELVPDVLRFAAAIGLRVDDQYRAYAAWPGDRVVTALVATEPGHIEPSGFWFPFVGRAPYKGFFEVERAEREAARLRAKGLATCLVPVPAYSTLGWLADPVMEPMLQGGVGRFVEMLLHELVHATVFVASEADWNESVATFIGQEAVVRFYTERGDAQAAGRERARVTDERIVAATLGDLRDHIAALYTEPAGPGRDAARAALERDTRAAVAALPLTSIDPAALADDLPLADPCLALQGTYEHQLPRWSIRLAELGDDLGRFVASARAAADTRDPNAALAGAPAPAR